MLQIDMLSWQGPMHAGDTESLAEHSLSCSWCLHDKAPVQTVVELFKAGAQVECMLRSSCIMAWVCTQPAWPSETASGDASMAAAGISSLHLEPGRSRRAHAPSLVSFPLRLMHLQYHVHCV